MADKPPPEPGAPLTRALVDVGDPQALRHLLEVFVTRSPDGLFIKDLHGRYVFANDAAAAMVDRSVQALLGATDDQVFSPETSSEILARDRQVVESGQPLTYLPSRRDFGAPRVFQTTKYPYRDPQGRLVGVLGVSRDVTEVVEAVRAAALSSAGFERLVEALPDLVLVLVAGRVRYANPAAVRLLGQGHDGKVLDRALTELCPEPVPVGGDLAEVGLVGPDGGRVRVEAVLVQTSWQGEAALALVARDIGARLELQARLVRSDRLAAVGELAAGLAHEINNPLTSLMLLLEEAATVAAEAEGAGALLADALACAERIAGLVRDLGTFSRASGSPGAAVDPRAEIEKAARMAAVRLKGRGRLELDLDPVPPVAGSPGGLWQVVLNLLVNAVHAVSQVPGRAHLLTVRLRGQPDGARIDIEDSGPGIPPELLERIFDPFVTTRSAGEGTGLGLSIARSIVLDAGGSLTVENRPEGGCRFTVLLPYAEQRPAPAPVADAPTIPWSDLRDAHILVVEDEAPIARALGMALGALGEVRLTATVDEARRALDEGVAWDLVLCDLLLPDGTGREVHHHATSRSADLGARFVFVTGGAPLPELRAWVQASGCEVIPKPFTQAFLVERVARWLRARQDRRVAPPQG
ncbi:PAS domain-containing protein [Myxococcota bacterium]|nr:PAS domain-containing protein [Myxococcota bacterium]